MGDAGYTSRKEDLDQACLSWNNLNQYNSQPQPPCSVDATDLYTFDYKKNFPIPNLNHNDIYYQRQLCIYLLGVQDCVRTKSLMYYYPETQANKGGSEVASMVYNTITRQRTGAKRCMFYTDGCGGQNRNRDVMTMMQKLTVDDSDKWFEQVDHTILLRGHTRLPNDADFAHIEKLEGIREVHLPEEYGNLIAESVREKGRFTPIPFRQDMLYDFRQLCKTTTKLALKDINGDKVNISQFRWFSYGKSQEPSWDKSNGLQYVTKQHHGEVWMRRTLDVKEPWVKVPVAKRGSTVSGKLVKKYNNVNLPIKMAKWDDLQKISNFLPLQKREFYKSLTHDKAKEIDDASSSSSDTEMSFD